VRLPSLLSGAGSRRSSLPARSSHEAPDRFPAPPGDTPVASWLQMKKDFQVAILKVLFPKYVRGGRL